MANEQPEQPAMSRGCQLSAVGCFTMVAGGAGGAMIGAMVLKILAFFRKIPKCTDMPVPCDWEPYVFSGLYLGAVLLPLAVLWRLRRSGADAGPSDRG